jgi:serpin B
LPTLPLDENLFADWPAHLFVADGTQYIMLGNTKSLYSTVMDGGGIDDASHFIERALSSIREFMQDDGQEFVYRRFIAAASETPSFSKALNRSVTGSMVDLINHATAWLIEEDLSPHDVGFRLNDVLLSSLARSTASHERRSRTWRTASSGDENGMKPHRIWIESWGVNKITGRSRATSHRVKMLQSVRSLVEKGEIMFSKRLRIRFVLGLFTSVAVISAGQIEAVEHVFGQAETQPGPLPVRPLNGGTELQPLSNTGGSSRLASMRRANRLTKRGRFGRLRSQPQAQYGAATTAAATKVKGNLDVGSNVSITADVRSIARSNNQFAFDLCQHLREQEGNQFFSPASISTALAMTYAGAAGETKKQMAKVLHFDLPDGRLQEGFGALNTMLNAKSKSYRLNVANRLWGQSGFHFEAPFLKSTLEHYGAELGKVDFAEIEPARRTINQWVAERTDGKIAGLLPPGVLQEKTRLVLTNAICFKGTWKYRFAKTDTHEAPFHITNDRQIQVPMMQQTGALRYAQVEDTQLLELPYIGGHLSMVILLPTRLDVLPALEKKLAAADVQKWISTLHDEDEVEVYIPKFSFTSQMGLKDTLSSLGMTLAFSDQADLSGISTEKEQKLFDMIHQAFVDVNEEGTEAAAATGHIGGDAPGPVPQRVVFRADHPFLFLIKDQRTGAILFLGRVVHPKE